VSVTVANAGPRASREFVQVYLAPAEPDQPVRLVGWRAVTAAPGESVRAEVHTDPRPWRRWNTADNGGNPWPPAAGCSWRVAWATSGRRWNSPATSDRRRPAGPFETA
jgi:Fibronectin type III-like domain